MELKSMCMGYREMVSIKSLYKVTEYLEVLGDRQNIREEIE